MSPWLLLPILACRAADPGPAHTVVLAGATAGWCGDGIVGEGEACDDGNGIGGDGCLPGCVIEEGPLESEPNDAPSEANPWPGAGVHGGLPPGDVDCFALDVPGCASVTVALEAPCPTDAVISLTDPTGIEVARGTARGDACPAIDPAIAPGARFVGGGGWAACVSSLTGTEIPSYVLDFTASDVSGLPVAAADDPDGDGLPDRCDPDRDGDAVLDVDDDCPDVPDGPGMAPLAPSGSGFLQDWLVLAPLGPMPAFEDCRPSLDPVGPEGDGVVPSLGGSDLGRVWVAWLSDADVLDLVPSFATIDAPREAYLQTWVYSATARDLTLAVGADDGVRVWWNGDVALDVSSCQGTNPDQFQAPVSVVAGWNDVLVKLRDNGGGWGLSVRLLDGGAPVTDLEVSLTSDGPWPGVQSDLDGDGVGDVCDESPAGGV